MHSKTINLILINVIVKKKCTDLNYNNKEKR